MKKIVKKKVSKINNAFKIAFKIEIKLKNIYIKRKFNLFNKFTKIVSKIMTI